MTGTLIRITRVKATQSNPIVPMVKFKAFFLRMHSFENITTAIATDTLVYKTITLCTSLVIRHIFHLYPGLCTWSICLQFRDSYQIKDCCKFIFLVLRNLKCHIESRSKSNKPRKAAVLETIVIFTCKYEIMSISENNLLNALKNIAVLFMAKGKKTYS